jgi:RND family efflux transporter MFP subunit
MSKRILPPTCLGILLWTAPAPAEELPATLDWSQRVDLATTQSGLVEAVLAQPGQTARRGEVLARLDARLFEANVMEAKADLERLSQDEADARRELERAKELYARGVSSTTELDIAKLRQARAAASLAGVQARVERARRQLEESQVRAPFDAIVLRRHAEPGMATAACQPTPLLGIARADELLARAAISARQAGGLALGARFEVIESGRLHAGRLRALVPTATGYAAEVVLGRAADLAPGMPVTLRQVD